MFTGLIEDVGTVRELRTAASSGGSIVVSTRLPVRELVLGESIAVNGVCLTLTRLGGDCFHADVSPETLARSTLGKLRPGQRVNLERALKLGDRLGGHLVTGHVDCQGRLVARTQHGNMELLRFSLQDPAERYLVEKGSVSVDGISLTLSRVDKELFEVAVIPHTLAQTTLGTLRTGDLVNLEMDIIGKYVARLLAWKQADEPAGLSREFLASHGFL